MLAGRHRSCCLLPDHVACHIHPIGQGHAPNWVSRGGGRGGGASSPTPPAVPVEAEAVRARSTEAWDRRRAAWFLIALGVGAAALGRVGQSGWGRGIGRSKSAGPWSPAHPEPVHGVSNVAHGPDPADPAHLIQERPLRCGVYGGRGLGKGLPCSELRFTHTLYPNPMYTAARQQWAK